MSNCYNDPPGTFIDVKPRETFQSAGSFGSVRGYKARLAGCVILIPSILFFIDSYSLNRFSFDAISSSKSMKKTDLNTTISGTTAAAATENISSYAEAPPDLVEYTSADRNDNHKDNIDIKNVNETFLFWNGGQKKLCQFLKNANLLDTLDKNDDTRGSTKILINVTMNCTEHYKKKQAFGQGNWITAIYASRMAAAVAGADFKFQCADRRESAKELLLPWFDQYVPAPPNRSTWAFSGTRPTAREACTNYYSNLRIDKMALQIQQNLRSMADAALSQNRNQLHDIDEVALHFRCGDILGGVKRNDFGLIRFSAYKSVIPRSTKTIGIFTQPFSKDLNRKRDSGKAASCRFVVMALVEYLQAHIAPSATITIRNGVNDSHPITYARMVMANVSITSLSSYGIFPVIGTYGEGYFQKGNGGVNPFAKYIPEHLPNIHMMEAEVIGSGEMIGKSIEDVISWLTSEGNE